MQQPNKHQFLNNHRLVSNPSYFVDRASLRAVESRNPSKISGQRNKYDNIKGRIAETLIRELFINSGYNVFNYGMEYAIPQIMNELNYSDVAEQIRRMPDFVIQNKDTKDVHFVEVKYRAKGEFRFENLSENYPYVNAFIIIVSKKHIKCLSVVELKAGKEFTPDCKNYLGHRSEFKLKKTVVVEFCKLANRLFESI